MHLIFGLTGVALMLAARWLRLRQRGVALPVELGAYALLAVMPWAAGHSRGWVLPYSLWSAALACLSVVAVVSYLGARFNNFERWKAIYLTAGLATFVCIMGTVLTLPIASANSSQEQLAGTVFEGTIQNKGSGVYGPLVASGLVVISASCIAWLYLSRQFRARGVRPVRMFSRAHVVGLAGPILFGAVIAAVLVAKSGFAAATDLIKSRVELLPIYFLTAWLCSSAIVGAWLLGRSKYR